MQTIYDEYGRPELHESRVPDGTVGTRIEYYYDSRPTKVVVFVGRMDVPDKTVSFEYDLLGRRTADIVDVTGPQPPDLRILYAYNSDGLLARTEFDEHVDGRAEAKETYRYDHLGRRIGVEWSDATGTTVESTDEYIVPFVGRGVITYYCLLMAPSYHSFTRLNEVGLPYHTEVDSDNNGEIDSESYLEYDLDGRVLRVISTVNGETTTSVEYTYDSAGRLTEQAYKSTSRGSFANVYSYECGAPVRDIGFQIRGHMDRIVDE